MARHRLAQRLANQGAPHRRYGLQCRGYARSVERPLLDPAKLWSHYLLLVAVEETFKNLKGDLAIRPVFHQLEARIEAHVFIAFSWLAARPDYPGVHHLRHSPRQSGKAKPASP
jgi:hypothetical protein